MDDFIKTECGMDSCTDKEKDHYEAIAKRVVVQVIRCPHCGEIAAEWVVERVDRLGFADNLAGKIKDGHTE